MNRRQTLLTAALSGFFTLALVAASMLFFKGALAAPPAQIAPTAAGQNPPGGEVAFVSVSSLVFTPLNPNAPFRKDVGRHLLGLDSQSRNFPANSNIFVAPLALADRAILTGLTLFGEDFDSRGAVRLRLRRCDHGQARCTNLAELTSTDNFAAGRFETIRVTVANERVDNSLFSYVLELELTALGNSGLRSVRLEMIGSGGAVSPPGPAQQWSLSGPVTNFALPNLNYAQVRVCTDDLSRLDNPTHYPFLVVDGRSIQLASNSCLTEWGVDFEIRRRLNTGPSSGTYQILR